MLCKGGVGIIVATLLSARHIIGQSHSLFFRTREQRKGGWSPQTEILCFQEGIIPKVLVCIHLSGSCRNPLDTLSPSPCPMNLLIQQTPPFWTAKCLLLVNDEKKIENDAFISMSFLKPGGVNQPRTFWVGIGNPHLACLCSPARVLIPRILHLDCC